MVDRSPGMLLAYLAQALIGVNVLLALLFKPSDFVIGVFLFLAGMALYVVAWRAKIAFPWFVYFLVSFALLIHTSGYIQERYLRFPYWDVLAHTVSGTRPPKLPECRLWPSTTRIVRNFIPKSGLWPTPLC